MHSETFAEKFSKLEVEAELQVSVLCSLLTLEGSGRYLSDQKLSARTVKSSLLYNIKTNEESLNIYHEDLEDTFVLDALKSGMATHIVVGISWGANLILSCQYQNVENRDVKQIEGILSAQLNKMSLSIKGKASVDFAETDNNKDLKFDIRIFGDVLPQNQELPTTFEGGLNLMKQMPKLIENSNAGRGKPLAYRLIPISLLKKYLNFSIKADAMIKFIEEECLLRVVQVFEVMSKTQQRLNDFYQNAIDHHMCIEEEDIVKIISFKDNFAIENAKFRSKLATTLSAVRSGTAKVSEIEDLIEEYRRGEISLEKLTFVFSTWGYIAEKIAFAKSLITNGAIYIGYGTDLDSEIMNNFDAKTYIFYFKKDAKNGEFWKENRQLFFQEIKKGGGNKYFAVDCDIHLQLWPKLGLSIEVVQDGKILTKNLLDQRKAMANTSFARCTLEVEKIVSRTTNRAHLVIPCTGKNCNPSREYGWMCEKCTKVIEYGFDDFFYCSCGRGPVSNYEFKCSDPNHGINFEQNSTFLKKLLKKIRPLKEMNILILGETGVGKSTWINGFINYLTYDSLQEAEENDLLTLVPSQFTVCDKGYNEIRVCTGIHKNECQDVGMSSTQKCIVYPFDIGDNRIRLIDTPGIGDVRGIEKDQENFQDILKTLSYLDELHGICILLKPNQSKLNIMFRFCITELLTYLHRDATHNIMFCFTNTRGTFYMPGDTLPPLKQLLQENNVDIPMAGPTIYCYDSEAYRFLAAVKNKPPVNFPDNWRPLFSQSWDQSITETKRMLQNILNLKPHLIKTTLSLNSVREVVIQLTKPMADISKIIMTTKAVIRDELAKIEACSASSKELEFQMHLTRPSIKVIPLPYPRTVCGNKACVTYIKNEIGILVAKYTTICHDECQLGNSVRPDTVGDSNLLKCLAFEERTVCNKCFHHYSEHLHTYSTSEDTVEKYIDLSMKAILEQQLSTAEKIRQLIELKNQEIKDNDEELKIIEEASVKFAFFLQRNATVLYNDAMIAYMDHLIREEITKITAGGSDKTLKSLKCSRESYREQIKILSKQMNRSHEGGLVLALEGIDDLVRQLKSLKRNGKKLEESLKAGIQAEKNSHVYQEVVVVPNQNGIWKKPKKWTQRCRDWFNRY